MRKGTTIKKKIDGFQCCVCGEQADLSQTCCGHPMIELTSDKDISNWKPLSELEKV